VFAIRGRLVGYGIGLLIVGWCDGDCAGFVLVLGV